MSEFTDMLVRQISLFGITDLIDICVVAYVMFQLIKLLRETRAIQLVKGLLALVAVYLAAYILQLRSISFLMQNVFQIGAIALIVPVSAGTAQGAGADGAYPGFGSGCSICPHLGQ